MVLLDADISMYVGYCIGSFGLGWGISTLLKTLKQLGEKI